MEIVSNVQAQSVCLQVTGRIGNTTCDEFQNEVMNAFSSNRKVIIDFDGVDYINSSGLRVLLLGMKKANELNTKLILRNVHKEVMELLNITGFINVLEIM